MNYKKETALINFKIGLVAFLFTIIMCVLLVIGFADKVKLAITITEPGGSSVDFTNDPDFVVPEDENILDEVDDSAAFDFGDTSNGSEDDFTFGTVDEAPEVDDTGGYDYNSDTSSSFDDTFVDQPSAESIAAADAWSAIIEDKGCTVHSDLINISDFVFEFTNFKSRVCSAFETVETEGLISWEDEVYSKSEEITATHCAFGSDEGGILTAVFFLEDGTQETVTGDLLGEATEATEDFSARVGTLIDSGDTVLSTLTPVLLTHNTTPKTAFNMFDDLTSANVRTSVLDWERFYTQYESWYAELDSVDSIGLLTVSVPEGNKFMALAYNDGGVLLGTTEFISEV